MERKVKTPIFFAEVSGGERMYQTLLYSVLHPLRTTWFYESFPTGFAFSYGDNALAQHTPCDFCILSGFFQRSDMRQWRETAWHAHRTSSEIGGIPCSPNQGCSQKGGDKRSLLGDLLRAIWKIFCLFLKRSQWNQTPVATPRKHSGDRLSRGPFIFPCSPSLVPQLFSLDWYPIIFQISHLYANPQFRLCFW